MSNDDTQNETPESDPPSNDTEATDLNEVPDSAAEEEKMTHAYKVELDVFEGPLDLLLYLVKRDEIDIYDISIERITTQYLTFIETFKELNIALAGEFLVMAANLCYIKSRMMLPKHVQPSEEEVEEEDPRWDLIKQLIEYKKFKEAANYLSVRETEEGMLYRNTPEKIKVDSKQERPLSEDIGIFDLIRAFQNIVDRFSDGDGLGEIVDDHYTVSDKIEFILETLKPGDTVSFYSLFEKAATKNELIVTFLAILELMKINLLRTIQEKILGEIKVHRPEGTEEGLYHQPTRYEKGDEGEAGEQPNAG